jgi:hemolysin III
MGVLKMFEKIRDPISGLSHLFGALLSFTGLAILVQYASAYGTIRHMLSFIVFGVSLILLYTASTLYHLLSVSDVVTKILRRIDHMMIYVLIAGTYTPICLIALRGIWGWSLLICIWLMAFAGIMLKLFWFNAPRWFSTLLYIIMGWLVVIAFIPLANAIPLKGILFLVLGGVSYSLGAVIYGTKWPRLNFKLFGFHEIFHIFVLLGSISHYWMMFQYVLYLK